MKAGSHEQEELLWRLALQLAAQLPVDTEEKAKVMGYVQALISPRGKTLIDEFIEAQASKKGKHKRLELVSRR